jgi:hypothetical protein
VPSRRNDGVDVADMDRHAAGAGGQVYSGTSCPARA